MYAQVEKPKEHKSRRIANSVAQNKRNEKQGFVFVDNRPEIIQKMNNNPVGDVFGSYRINGRDT